VKHPEYAWQAPLLRDMKAGPWTQFKTGDREASASHVKIKLKNQPIPSADHKDNGD